MLNWKVRIKNKAFWLALVPALLLLVQAGAAVVGVAIDWGELGNRLLALINAVFALLSVLGVVNDPTTQGLADSSLAMTYQKPKQTGQALPPEESPGSEDHNRPKEG